MFTDGGEHPQAAAGADSDVLVPGAELAPLEADGDSDVHRLNYIYVNNVLYKC